MRGHGAVTVVEVVAVGAIGAVMLGVFGGSFGDLQGRMAVRAAESRLVELHERAREHAAEEGVPVRFAADPRAQTVTLTEGCHGSGRIIATHDFNLSYRVDMLTSDGVLEMCMTPGGYTQPGFGPYLRDARVTFLRAAHSGSVVLLPLGRVARP